MSLCRHHMKAILCSSANIAATIACAQGLSALGGRSGSRGALDVDLGQLGDARGLHARGNMVVVPCITWFFMQVMGITTDPLSHSWEFVEITAIVLFS